MSIFRWFADMFSSGSESACVVEDSFLNDSAAQVETSSFNNFAVNPANGLAMVDGIGGIDVAGNPFGTDYSHHDMLSSSSSSMFDYSGDLSSGSVFSDW